MSLAQVPLTWKLTTVSSSVTCEVQKWNFTATIKTSAGLSPYLAAAKPTTLKTFSFLEIKQLKAAVGTKVVKQTKVQTQYVWNMKNKQRFLCYFII